MTRVTAFVRRFDPIVIQAINELNYYKNKNIGNTNQKDLYEIHKLYFFYSLV